MLQILLQGAESWPDEPSGGLWRRTWYFQASSVSDLGYSEDTHPMVGGGGVFGVTGTLCWKVRDKMEQRLHTLWWRLPKPLAVSP